jgi:hypothetical protein
MVRVTFVTPENERVVVDGAEGQRLLELGRTPECRWKAPARGRWPVPPAT